jgi:hypothetical protein
MSEYCFYAMVLCKMELSRFLVAINEISEISVSETKMYCSVTINFYIKLRITFSVEIISYNCGGIPECIVGAVSVFTDAGGIVAAEPVGTLAG